MSDINLARRSFLKSGAAVAATLMASAAANAVDVNDIAFGIG